jgi:ribosomal protein S18 acetylase RimI-like enzyme
VRVARIERVTQADVDAVGHLLGQLSRSPAPDLATLARIVASDSVRLLVARDGDAVVGMLALVLVPLPSGLRARLEDVVVDETARGRGVGRMLSEEAVRLAQEAGARDVDLTSRPERGTANALYESLGFRERQTRAYRLDFQVSGE